MLFFFFIDPPTTEIYTLSLHDALPILADDEPVPACRNDELAPDPTAQRRLGRRGRVGDKQGGRAGGVAQIGRATSELQSRQYLVCRLLLEKNKHLMVYLSALAQQNAVG